MNAEHNPANEFFGSARSEQDSGVTRYIHPSAKVADNVKIWHFAVIQKDAIIGDGCSIGSHVEISAGCVLGKNVRIGFGSITAPSMKIGNDVFIGPNVTFCDDDKPVAGNVNYERRPPTVYAGASIGAGAIIMPGVTIGSHSMVGAGCIVLHDVPSFSTVYTEAKTVVRMPPC